MKNEFDTSWFNLRNYDELTDLDLSGWYDQIIYRRIIKIQMEEIRIKKNFPEIQKELAKELRTMCENIKKSPVQPESKEFSKTQGNNSDTYPFNTHSVKSTPIGPLFEDINNIYRFNLCNFKEKANDPDKDKQASIYHTPIDLFFYHAGMKGRCSSLLTVNLECSDEKILQDFRSWLMAYRRYNNFYSKKKKFSEKDFREWRNDRLLPYLDLTLIAEVEGGKLTQDDIGALIHPHIEVVMADKIRRTTRKKAQMLIRASTVTAMEAQLLAFMS